MGIGRFVVLATLLLMSTALPASAAGVEEHELLVLINEARAEAALAPLTPLGDLVDDARRHTTDMIEAQELYHSSTREMATYTTGWSLLGENVGLGPNTVALHRAFMASTTHAENVLGDFEKVGIGADRGVDGTLYVTVLFMQSAEPGDDRTVELSPLSHEALEWFSPAAPMTSLADRAVTRSEPIALQVGASESDRCVAAAVCAD